MNELPSAEFRKAYAKLTEQTLVTVNGHPIGTWCPGTLPPVHRVTDYVGASPQTQRDDGAGKLPGGGIQARQAQRDALLRGINRSK